MKITKAVIAAAGLGTRFLPATKAVPKEMLPLLDRPILQHVVEEAVNSGITDIILVIRRGSSAITDYFDSAPELERTLEATGKFDYLEEVRRVSQLAKFAFVRQGADLPYGNGSPLLAARPFISKDEILVYMFGDDVIDANPPGMRQVMDGNFSICRILATVPTRYISSSEGSSGLSFFCVVRNTSFPLIWASSIALSERFRPTKKGTTMRGNTTRSRSGTIGRSFFFRPLMQISFCRAG